MFPPAPGQRLNNGAITLASTAVQDDEAIVLAQWCGRYVTWHGHAAGHGAEPMYLSGEYGQSLDDALDSYNRRVAATRLG